MKALISPNETVRDFNGAPLGMRIAQIHNDGFEVAKPFFWVDCPVEVNDWEWYYADGEFKQIPRPPEVVPEQE